MSTRESAPDGTQCTIDPRASDVGTTVVATLSDTDESRYSTGRFGSDGLAGIRVDDWSQPGRTVNG
ncbi:hypothetical protein [Rhodococcus xishaensis]|uniref:Uncharacterized protein n=1 Tax=Rhodococcus xishaensis TaxID=2487364 RepID=A0A3S3ZP64_9NOCA|nr:hypothetical protein [Rhodococcus xishaensis]RVW05124.1 hypothetical protein EGT50_00305 [Rhodococcus xishaensis]